jgi:hypothetical protein
MKQRNGQTVGSIDANHSSNFSPEKVNISDPEMLQRMYLDWKRSSSLLLIVIVFFVAAHLYLSSELN